MSRPFYAALFLGFAAAQPAAAQSVSAAFPETIVEAMRDAGLKAVLTTDDDGDPKIDCSTGEVNFGVYFYGCEENGTRCQHIQLSAGFDLVKGIGAAVMNDWNRTYAFGRAHIDGQGDPFLQHYIVAVDGMSRENFNRMLDMWRETLGDFTRHIGW